MSILTVNIMYIASEQGMDIGSSRPNKESIPSRAYIAFRNEEKLATFSQAYDGHLFRDKAGMRTNILKFSSR